MHCLQSSESTTIIYLHYFDEYFSLKMRIATSSLLIIVLLVCLTNYCAAQNRHLDEILLYQCGMLPSPVEDQACLGISLHNCSDVVFGKALQLQKHLFASENQFEHLFETYNCSRAQYCRNPS